MAERLAVGYLDAALGAESAALRVQSAGTNAVVDSGMHPYSAAALGALGGDPSEFVARQLTDDMAAQSDLVLGLTREHRHAALKRAPRGLSRTFTLLEAADLADLVPRDADLPGATVADRSRALVRQMAAARARRAGGEFDDIPDPIGSPAGVHAKIGDLIAEGVLRLFGRFAELGSTPGRTALRAAEPIMSTRRRG
jgi:protein-tyrosine phosphatase